LTGWNKPQAIYLDIALAFVWLGRVGVVVAVHFFESAGAALRQRRLALRGTDAASLEEVALVVRSAVSALLERLEDQEEPEAPVEQKPSPRHVVEKKFTPAPQVRTQNEPAPFWLGLGWVGQSYSADLPFSHGAHLEVGYRPTRGNFGFAIGYQFLPSQTAHDGHVAVTLRRHPLEALLSWKTSDWQRWLFVGAEAGAMLDVSRRVALVSTAELESEPDATRLSWALSGRAFFGVRLGERMVLKGLGGADLLAQRVVVELGDGQALLTPHRIRPRLMALVLWNFP
jgi:hypothetical protein